MSTQKKSVTRTTKLVISKNKYKTSNLKEKIASWNISTHDRLGSNCKAKSNPFGFNNGKQWRNNLSHMLL